LDYAWRLKGGEPEIKGSEIIGQVSGKTDRRLRIRWKAGRLEDGWKKTEDPG